MVNLINIEYNWPVVQDMSGMLGCVRGVNMCFLIMSRKCESCLIDPCFQWKHHTVWYESGLDHIASVMWILTLVYWINVGQTVSSKSKSVEYIQWQADW